MKMPFMFLIIGILIFGCSQVQNCRDDINKLPIYGNLKKCGEQIEADRQFLKGIDDKHESRNVAAGQFVKRGWAYFYRGQLDTSMMRFNQAWLLDSLNSEVYWGFANILGRQKNFKASLYFFNRSLKLDSGNAKVWYDQSISYGNLFVSSSNKLYLDSSIYVLKKSIGLDPHNAQAYSQLTAAYCYFIQKDSAKKYLKLTDQIDPTAVNEATRKILTGGINH
ncbi:MAG: Tetratricopeptide 1 repeat-containing protein [Mucilaginibacter sp.]|nr:Tetratricopeptide 1 repeat-containing protein [Mucilaginibacter sp.]